MHHVINWWVYISMMRLACKWCKTWSVHFSKQQSYVALWWCVCHV